MVNKGSAEDGLQLVSQILTRFGMKENLSKDRLHGWMLSE